MKKQYIHSLISICTFLGRARLQPSQPALFKTARREAHLDTATALLLLNSSPREAGEGRGEGADLVAVTRCAPRREPRPTGIECRRRATYSGALYNTFLAALLLGAFSISAQGDDVIKIVKPANQLIRVAVTGFGGDAEAILDFDLSALGMEITTPDKAEFVVAGHANGKVEGSLLPAGASQPLWTRGYSGGSARSQAHALANDVVKEIRQTPPIFLDKIARSVISEGSSTEICVSDFDGFGATPVTRDGSLVAGPAWIPGGGGLFYTSWKNGDTQILKHNLSTGARSVFAGYPGANFSAEVSPDGQKVAMILSKGGNPNLYVSGIDGGNPRKLTSTHEEDSSPCWNPGSSEICYVSRSGRARLEVISAEGGQPRPLRVTGVFANMTSPDWSPDGKLSRLRSGSGNFTICVVPAGGGEAQKLTDGEDPCWAPNSRTVIFCRSAIATNEPYVCLTCQPNTSRMSGNFRGTVQSLRGRGKNRFPSIIEQNEKRKFTWINSSQHRHAGGLATGCQHKPVAPTPIPDMGQRPSNGSGSEHSQDNGATLQNTCPADHHHGAKRRLIMPNTGLLFDGPHNEDRDKFKADTVYFDFDSSTVKPSEESKLNDVANYFKEE